MFSCRGFRLFLDRLIGGGNGGGLSTTLSLGLRCGGWSPSLDGDLDPLIGVGRVGSVCVWGTSGRVFWGTQLGYIIRESLFL